MLIEIDNRAVLKEYGINVPLCPPKNKHVNAHTSSLNGDASQAVPSWPAAQSVSGQLQNQTEGDIVVLRADSQPVISLPEREEKTITPAV